MGEVKIKSLKVDGRDFDVYVNESGCFFAMLPIEESRRHGGDRIEALTLDLLEKKIRATARQKLAKLAIPVTMLVAPNWRRADQAISLRDATVYGVHATQRKPLVKYEDTGEKEAVDSSDCDTLRRLTPDEAAAVVGAHAAKLAADEVYQTMINGLKVNPIKLVEDAVAKLTPAEV